MGGSTLGWDSGKYFPDEMDGLVISLAGLFTGHLSLGYRRFKFSACIRTAVTTGTVKVTLKLGSKRNGTPTSCDIDQLVGLEVSLSGKPLHTSCDCFTRAVPQISSGAT